MLLHWSYYVESQVLARIHAAPATRPADLNVTVHRVLHGVHRVALPEPRKAQRAGKKLHKVYNTVFDTIFKIIQVVQYYIECTRHFLTLHRGEGTVNSRTVNSQTAKSQNSHVSCTC